MKDEKHYDRYDRAFAAHFKGASRRRLREGHPGRLAAQDARARADRGGKGEGRGAGRLGQADGDACRAATRAARPTRGGSKWIGTGGTSPFGHGGFNPEGIRIGGQGGGRRAVKVWEKREFRNLDDTIELGTRNIKIALRKLRRFARDGAAEEFDLEGTIDSTARNAGLLDLRFVPERHNAVKVLLFLDVGGSMESHVRVCEELFSAARSEFKHLEYYYFHNFLYESVWRDGRRRHAVRTPTLEILRTHLHPTTA